MSDTCKCNHSKDDHIRTVIRSAPGNPKSVPIGEIYRCRLCLCQDFEPQETEAKE